MGTEYRVTFLLDERYEYASARTGSDLWREQRPRLEARLRTMAECTTHGTAMEMRAPASTGAIPDLVVVLGDDDIYVCDYGNHPLASRIVGAIVMSLADSGLVITFATLE